MLTRQFKLFNPRYTLIRALLTITLFFSFSSAFATNLLDVYQAALRSDPVFQAAVSARLSAREAIPLHVAALLPSINGQASIASNYQDIIQAPSSTPLGETRFINNGYSISIKQPLLNIGSWIAVTQASYSGKEADAKLGAAAQSLIYRVAKTYFQVLLAQDNLRLAQAEKAANAKQLEQSQKRLQVGSDTLTTLYAARAAYDKSLANEITAQNALQNSEEAIRQLTGQTYKHLSGFKQAIPLLSPQPKNIENWIQATRLYNLNLMAQRYALEVAREDIKIKASGHLPTLDLIGSYGRNNGLNLGTTNQNTGVVGLQLNVPLFSGGSVRAQTQKSEYDFQTASANLDNCYRQVVVLTRQKYHDVLADISKIKAERLAIKSAQLSLISTQESFKAGTRTIVDVLLAQQSLYDAKRMAAQDQINYLLDGLALKQSSGILNVNDLALINHYLSS